MAHTTAVLFTTCRVQIQTQPLKETSTNAVEFRQVREGYRTPHQSPGYRRNEKQDGNLHSSKTIIRCAIHSKAFPSCRQAFLRLKKKNISCKNRNAFTIRSHRRPKRKHPQNAEFNLHSLFRFYVDKVFWEQQKKVFTCFDLEFTWGTQGGTKETLPNPEGGGLNGREMFVSKMATAQVS